MLFSEILAALPWSCEVAGDAAVHAPVVESDADLQPGGVFVARRGLSSDGHDFIPRAIERGAIAIVGERDLHGLSVPYARVDDAQESLGYLAAAYHGFPSRRLTLIGVTGTDGKTTTSTLIHSILQIATGHRAGLISTVVADLGDLAVDTGLHVTTPSAPQVQALLAQMVRNGLTHCVLEMTSHGLAQGRLNGVDIDVAVLTNLTHEHLDYHGSFENYRAAKGRMFAMLAQSVRKPGQPKVSVVNGDDLNADYFAAFSADRVIRYGSSGSADISPSAMRFQPSGTAVDVSGVTLISPLVGQFNVQNILAAVAAASAVGIDLSDSAVQEGIARVRGVPGRMERIDLGQNYTAIVDFAHTPNALAQALRAGRALLPAGSRLIAVFGSAGLRDREKRRMMAEVSAQLADFTILTAEDPRTESLQEILEAMAQGCCSQGGIEGRTFLRIPDRGEAIFQACQLAQAGDIVMACGKGHEQSMCFGTVEYPWDDREAMRAALRGAPLRTLPTARA